MFRFHPPRRFPVASRLLCLAAMLLLTAQVTPASAQDAIPRPTKRAALSPEIDAIPVPGSGTFGGDISMHTEIFKPEGPGPFPVLIFLHGRAPDRLERASLKRSISDSHVRFWLSRGVAVVAPIRIGYGETGGPDRENAGAAFAQTGGCTSKPDFRTVSKHANEAVLASINWVRSQSWADKSRIVLEGRSMGGFSAVSAAATRPEGVIGYINFSGGAGGSPERSPGKSCDQEQMREVMGEFGKTAVIPGLWLYAGNDQYFGAEAPQTWYAAFAAGGSPVKLVSVPEVPGHDGHLLLSYGGKFWREDLQAFVKSLGL